VLHLANVLAACVLVAQVSGNNLSACTGAVISSRMVSRRTGLWIAIAGYSPGLMIEGPAMRAAFTRLMPNSTEPLVMTALGTGIVIFLIAHLNRVPQSLSQTFAAVILGIGAARHVAVDRLFVLMMLVFWICAPILSIVLIVFLMRFSRRIVNERNVWDTIRKVKASLLVFSFFAAFALGGNTIGFVYAAVPYDPRTLLIVVLAIIVGSTLFSTGELRRIGNEIVAVRYINAITAQFSSIVLVEVATLLGVPLSYTVVFTSGVYGAGFSYKHRLLTAKSAGTIATSWLAMLAAGFLIGYVATATLRRHASL
jgi:inorganic phosphate transporter, PiT family